jgi:hypothetical protein
MPEFPIPPEVVHAAVDAYHECESGGENAGFEAAIHAALDKLGLRVEREIEYHKGANPKATGRVRLVTDWRPVEREPDDGAGTGCEKCNWTGVAPDGENECEDCFVESNVRVDSEPSEEAKPGTELRTRVTYAAQMERMADRMTRGVDLEDRNILRKCARHLRELDEALRFYANPDNYIDWGAEVDGELVTPVARDHGKRAHKALMGEGRLNAISDGERYDD